MYIALGIMLLGILFGRLLMMQLSSKLIHSCITVSIMLLLFLLGVSIGSNYSLLAQLPSLGLDSLLIMLFCVAGSVIAQLIIGRIFDKRKLQADKEKQNNER